MIKRRIIPRQIRPLTQSAILTICETAMAHLTFEIAAERRFDFSTPTSTSDTVDVPPTYMNQCDPCLVGMYPALLATSILGESPGVEFQPLPTRRPSTASLGQNLGQC